VHSDVENKPVAVIGATGHTGRFVIDELRQRNREAILIARDGRKLKATAAAYPGSAARVASLDDPASLDTALAGAAAVINCAGPFADTALPVLDAALRAKIPYLDIAAEQTAVESVDTRDAQARQAQVVVLPGAAFYGGLADLLASSISSATRNIDEIAVAVALDSWHPTAGTRVTGERNTSPRCIVRNGILQPMPDPQPEASWSFPVPFGNQRVAMLPLSETVTLARHLKANAIVSWINLTALREVRDATTPPPTPVDERGHSAQTFVMDVLIRDDEGRRRATALGNDIYAISAPIVVEAVERLLSADPAPSAGVRSLGELFDARDFLAALVKRGDLHVDYGTLA
jgi:hypothetical protein